MGWGLAEKWNPRLSKPYGVGSGQTLNPTTEAAPTALRSGCVLCCVCVLGRDYAQFNFLLIIHVLELILCQPHKALLEWMWTRLSLFPREFSADVDSRKLHLKRLGAP